jgi:hypothetical protein
VQIPIGVANSVSYNLDYDPLDTLYFAAQSGFEIIQIYINDAMLASKNKLTELKNRLLNLPDISIYFHSDGAFNEAYTTSSYKESFFKFLQDFSEAKIIYHFDENEDLENILKIISYFEADHRQIYLENYFQFEGITAAEKNLRKFTAVFSLANNSGMRIHPVIDIPRFFNARLGFSEEAALNWCFQLLNFFGNRKIPVLFHLIDSKTGKQESRAFCPIGEGIIPYQKIFKFLLKNGVSLEGIILEYLDKVNPLKSRDNLNQLLKEE